MDAIKIGVVAKALGVDPRTVRRYVSRGQLAAWRPSPTGKFRFDPADVLKYMAVNGIPRDRLDSHLLSPEETTP
jgi:excisionase family DNA binding protein